jgi:hypothetical protein
VALLGSRALAAAPELLPQSFADAVEQAVAANRARGLALEGLTEHLAGRLAAQGIRSLALKGPLLARRLHGDEGLRATNDLDLLVDQHHLEDAVAVAAELGYRVDPEDRSELHRTLRDPAGRMTRIELHWRVHWYEDAFSRELLERSRPARGALLEAPPDDDLAALLLFYARDGFFGLRAAADIAAWWDRHGEDARAPVLERHWERHPALRRALRAAATAAERIAAVPADRLLPHSARPTARTRVAVRLASPSGAGEYDQLAADIGLVDLLLSPPGGLRPTLRRHVFLPARRLDAIYGLSPGAGVRRALWRLIHPPKVLARYALGLLRTFKPR